MTEILRLIYDHTSEGGAVYFMQREKNTEKVLKSLRESGWEYQNLIIWKKKTSAVPSDIRFAKQFQVIVFATKGKPRLFHKLRIDPPLPAEYKYKRENGVYLTDVWADIREMTSGYFAGDEALRDEKGKRIHTQQSPIALLLRIILSSSKTDDLIFDPFAGSGTTLVTAQQLKRESLGIEIDPANVELIEKRTAQIRPADEVERFRKEYVYTDGLEKIWPKRSIPLLSEA